MNDLEEDTGSEPFQKWNTPSDTLADTPSEQATLLYIRLWLHASQRQLAEQIGVTQPTISKLENASDMKVSSLRRYVEGLNGTLELTADFDGRRIGIAFPQSDRRS